MKKIQTLLIGLIVCCVAASFAGPRQKAETPRPDVQFRLAPWDDALFSPFLTIGHFEFTVDGETSFSIGGRPGNEAHEFIAGIGIHYLLHDATNTFEYKAVSNTGRIGETDIIDVYLIPEPPPTPVPDPVPPGFRVISVEPLVD